MSGEELRVVIDPKIAFGQPCIMPGRVPVHAIVDRFRAGESVASLCADYGIDNGLRPLRRDGAQTIEELFRKLRLRHSRRE